MSNREIVNKYNSLFYHIGKGEAMPELPKTCHVHDLRSCYMRFVFTLWNCPYTFQRIAMELLGHDAITVSLSYGSVRLENIDHLQGMHGDIELSA